MLFISFIFMLAFRLGSSQGHQPYEDSKYLAVNSNFREFCWLHTKTRPSKVGGAVTPPRLWTTSGLLSRGFSQQDLPHQSFVGILGTRPN